MAKDAMKQTRLLVNNPREVTEKDALNIYQTAWQNNNMKEKEKDIFEKTIKFNTGIKLYMFQTGSIKTKLKFIKMNQGEEPYEIPVPWFLIKHPEGDVIIDGGMPIEAALDKHKHWGDVVDAYDPVMNASEWCKDMVKTVNTNPEDVKYVIQTHLHLDHSGAIGHWFSIRWNSVYSYYCSTGKHIFF